MKQKNAAAVEMGKKSAEKQFGTMSKEEKSKFFKQLRSQRKDSKAKEA